MRGYTAAWVHCFLQGTVKAALTLSKPDLVLANPYGCALHTLQHMLYTVRKAWINMAQG